MFNQLTEIARRPKVFECYTAQDLWADAYISKKMLEFHLNEDIEPASRNHAFIQQSTDWIVSRFNVGGDTAICDFGCGPGLYTTRFARAGADVTGVDFSERSIRHARETAAREQLEIDYVHQDYLTYTAEKRFDLITLIYDDFCPLSPAQRKTMLTKFHQLLKDGGAVLLDVLTLNHFDATEEKRTYEFSEKDGFWSASPCHIFLNTFKYKEEKVILDKYDLFEKDRTRKIYNWLQCFSVESLDTEFRESGFRIIEKYSDVAGAPYQPESIQMAVVAVKI